MNNLKLFSYVITHDLGFSPNPYWGKMTLNCCKPKIRLNAKKGDWIIGVGATEVIRKGKMDIKNYSGRLVYAMEVTEVMAMHEYDKYCSAPNSVLQNKIPSNTLWKRKVGDCIYDFKRAKDSPIQRKGMHNRHDMAKDISGQNTLISTNYYYFGASPLIIDKKFITLIHKGRAHSSIEDQELIEGFIKWLKLFPFDKNDMADPQLKCDINMVYDSDKNEGCSIDNCD